MSIKIKYFASLREAMGRAEDHMETDSARTVGELWMELNGDHPLPSNTLIAVNMEYADIHRSVCDGDEVAFFPPVTGG